MTYSLTLPVIASLASGIALIVIVSFSISGSLQISDIVRIANGLNSVRAFATHYPELIITTNETTFEPENVKLYRIYYTVSESYKLDRHYEIPAVLIVTLNQRGDPLVITIECHSKDGTDYSHIGDSTNHVVKFFERSENCP